MQPCQAPPITLKIRLFDTDHQPLADAPFELIVDGQSFSGSTDGSGMLTQQVPGSATSGKLTLDMWSFELTIQPLGAPDSETGASVRLENLGYYADDTAGALMRFQSANELEADGRMNDATKSKLVDIYGS